jgi:hypothetical protein
MRESFKHFKEPVSDEAQIEADYELALKMSQSD